MKWCYAAAGCVGLSARSPDPPNGDTKSAHRRAKPQDVAIGILDCAFVLTPLRVLGHMDLSSCGEPLPRKPIRIINPQVRRVFRIWRVAVRIGPKMDFDPVTTCKPIPTAFVLPNGESEALVVTK